MVDEKPSIQAVIAQWKRDHNGSFPAKTRLAQLENLIELCVVNGFGRFDIERVKAKIMDILVGENSKYGSKGLKDWKKNASEDFEDAILASFERVVRPTGPVEIPYTPKVLTDKEKLETERQELNELKEFNESLDEKIEETPERHYTYDIDKAEYDQKASVIRPELDRTMFKKIQTTPILSDEEYFAILERENNER